MNGVLVVDKPSGPTSHDVVNRVRRALATKRIGHTGTLDPLATGVLALLVGVATRLAQFLTSDTKEYIADIRFGVATTTYDAAGEPLPSGDGHATAVDLSGIEAALATLRGTYLQTPPAFSAKKVAGVRAYELARAGTPIDLVPVQVTVSALELLEQGTDTAKVRVACSSGFYVRTLAHEIGRTLGCGAHLSALRRTRAGTFAIEDATPLSEVEAAGSAATCWVKPLGTMLPDLPTVFLTEGGARRAAHGSRLTAADVASGELGGSPARRVRLLTSDGILVGIAGPAGDGLQPLVVLGSDGR